MSEQTTQRRTRAKASVFMEQSEIAWLVTETPSEVADRLDGAVPGAMLKFTLGNDSDWNGRPLYIRADAITAISPPRAEGGEDD